MSKTNFNQSPVEMERQAYSIDEWRAMYGFGRNFTYDLIAAGKLKSTKLGRKRLITKKQNQEFAESLESEGNA
tara:strand:- start:6926 stop:7144 length:219 start_codon:yes stop_codon:yes gene_type:complete